MTLDDFGDNSCFCQVVSVITEAGLPQVFGANLVGGQVCIFWCIFFWWAGLYFFVHFFGGQVTFFEFLCAFFREKTDE